MWCTARFASCTYLLALNVTLSSAVHCNGGETLPQRDKFGIRVGIIDSSLSHDGRYLACCRSDGVIDIWDVFRQRVVDRIEPWPESLKNAVPAFKVARYSGFRPSRVAFGGKSERLFFSESNFLFGWKWRKGRVAKLGRRLPTPEMIRDIAAIPGKQGVFVLSESELYQVTIDDSAPSGCKVKDLLPCSDSIGTLHPLAPLWLRVTIALVVSRVKAVRQHDYHQVEAISASDSVVFTDETIVNVLSFSGGRERPKTLFRTGKGVIVSLSVQGSRKLFAAGAQEPARVVLYDQRKGKLQVIGGDFDDFALVSLSPDGNLLAVADGRKLYLYRTVDGKQIAQTEGFTTGPTTVGFLHDGKTIYMTGERPFPRYWEVTGQKLREITKKHKLKK